MGLRFRRAARGLRARMARVVRRTRGRRVKAAPRKKLAQPIARVRARVRPAGQPVKPVGYQKAGATTRAAGKGGFKVVWAPNVTLRQRVLLVGEVMSKTNARVSGTHLPKSTVSVPVTMLGRAKSMFGVSRFVTRTE
jgi:hypothetical protein